MQEIAPILLPDLPSEFEYLTSLRCDCGGHVAMTRAGPSSDEGAMLRDSWRVSCRTCRKTWELTFLVPALPGADPKTVEKWVHDNMRIPQVPGLDEYLTLWLLLPDGSMRKAKSEEEYVANQKALLASGVELADRVGPHVTVMTVFLGLDSPEVRVMFQTVVACEDGPSYKKTSETLEEARRVHADAVADARKTLGVELH